MSDPEWNSDPEFPEESNPDPKIWISDPQHWLKTTFVYRSEYFGCNHFCAQVQGLQPHQQHSPPGDQETKP